MAWQCLCEGATGLIFYSWFDVKRNPDVPFQTQWESLKRIAAEIDRFAPVVLSVEAAPTVQIDAAPAQPRWLHTLRRSRGGKAYLFAVNNGDADGTVTFSAAKQPKRVTELGDNRRIKPDGRRFQDELKKLDVRIYEIEW